MAWDEGRGPVRAANANESNRLSAAGRTGPFVAWRDPAGALQVHALGPHTPATIGRSEHETIRADHPEVSREHAEVTVRVHGVPPATSVFLLDYSKHGTEHRRVTLTLHGAERDVGEWRKAPQLPARAHQLDEGAHDIRLAGERCLLIAGVPVDSGRTADREEESLPAPTVRQRQVLIELCRPFFENPGKLMAPPSNAVIAVALGLNEDSVRKHVADLYKRYDLTGSGGPRLALVELAREHELVDATDFR